MNRDIIKIVMSFPFINYLKITRAKFVRAVSYMNFLRFVHVLTYTPVKPVYVRHTTAYVLQQFILKHENK